MPERCTRPRPNEARADGTRPNEASAAGQALIRDVETCDPGARRALRLGLTSERANEIVARGTKALRTASVRSPIAGAQALAARRLSECGAQIAHQMHVFEIVSREAHDDELVRLALESRERLAEFSLTLMNALAGLDKS